MLKKKPFRWKKGLAIGVPRNPVEPPKPRRKRGRGITVVSEPKLVRQSRKLPSEETAADASVRKAEYRSRLPNHYWIQGGNSLWSSVERGSLAHLENPRPI